jgi:hypothetical protein
MTFEQYESAYPSHFEHRRYGVNKFEYIVIHVGAAMVANPEYTTVAPREFERYLKERAQSIIRIIEER